MALAGCASPLADPRLCPRERVYSAAEQKALLADMKRSPARIREAMVDYGKLRDAARACRGEAVPR